MGAALLLSMLLGGAASALEVRLTVPDGYEGPAEVELVATAVAGPGELPAALRHTVRGRSWVATLRPGVTYRLEVVAPGWWATPVTVRAGEIPGPVVMPLWPTTSLVLPWARELPAAAQMEVGFPLTGRLGPGALPTHQVPCTAREPGWVCHVPAFVRDVRVVWPGSAPLYLFDLDLLPHTEWRLPQPLPHRPGGSVSGWVVGESPLEEVRVQLLPPPGRGEGDRSPPGPRGEASAPVPCTTRGFFQFTGLAAGGRLLGAGGKGRRAVPRWVEVGSEGETVVTEGIAVGPPVWVAVEVDPPLHPGGSPWRVAARPPEVPWEAWPGGFGASPGNEAGKHVFAGLAPGRWEAVVAGPADMAWLRQEMEVHQGMQPLRLLLEVLAVEGRVRRGKAPWQGELEWADEQVRLVRVVTDQEGRFSCTLPGPGEYQVTLWGRGGSLTRKQVTVPPAPPAGRAEVEIQLPAEQLVGRVLDEEGDGVPGAQVVFLAGAEGRALPQVVLAGPGGRFAVEGVERKQKVIVWATHEQGRSREVEVAERHWEGEELRLVLREQWEIRGWVSSPLGRVARATVRVVPWTSDAALGLRAVNALADGEGRFAVAVPAHTVEAAIVVAVPGYGLALAGWRVGAEGEVVVTAPAQSGRLRLPRKGLWELRTEGVRVPGFFLTQWASLGGEEWLELQVAPGFYSCCPLPHPAAWVPGATPPLPCAQGSLAPGGELTLEPPPPPGAKAFQGEGK